MSTLELLKQRDAPTQAAVRCRVYPKLRRLCRHLLQDEIASEHAAADIWTDFLFRDVDHLRGEHALDSYVRMMAVRRCLRMRRMAERLTELDDAQLAAGSEAEAVRRLDEQRTLERLARCVERLAPRTRRVLRLRFHHELTLRAIGASLDVSKQQVGRVVDKGLNTLRGCLEDHDEDARAGAPAGPTLSTAG